MRPKTALQDQLGFCEGRKRLSYCHNNVIHVEPTKKHYYEAIGSGSTSSSSGGPMRPDHTERSDQGSIEPSVT